MTDHGTPTPPGHYRASDGRDYPIPEGHVLGADGQLHRLPAPPPPSTAPPPPGAPTTASTWTWDVTSILLLAGAAAVVVGAFLPWATAGSFSKAGTEGDGSITLVLGIAAAALGALGLLKRSRGMRIGSVVAAALVVLIAVIDMADVGSAEVFGISFEIGIGLYMTLVGGLGALLGAVLALRRRPTAA